MGFRTISLACLLLGGTLAPGLSYGQTIPGSADVSRVTADKMPNVEIPDRKDAIKVPKETTQNAPEGAETITFVLKDIRFSGSTAFSDTELKSAYADIIGKTISLDKAWLIAAQTTNKYRADGYFLSRAYVPAQTIDDGILKITVVEGFIEDVRVTNGDGAKKSPLLNKWLAELKSKKPIKTHDLEEALLELNSGTGFTYRAVLLPPKAAQGAEGAADLELVQSASGGNGFAQLDNYGSKFLGVHELRASYNQSFLPDQTTGISFLTSLPTKQINNAALNHKINFMKRMSLELSTSYTRTEPGDRLKVQEIKGKSYSFGAALNYQWIRHRDEQLSTRVEIDHTASTTDILSTLLSEDKVNVLRLGTHYAAYDLWQGYNDITATLSQGVAAFGASEDGDSNLSRAEAVPDFRKLELSYFRQQQLPYDVRMIYKLRGQWASDPLYSSEEFGYGGQDIGRAYDGSDIVGDKGLSTSLEAAYAGMAPVWSTSFTPYVFYDIGKVWNLDQSGQVKSQSASSAGAGIRIYNDPTGLSGGIGLAFPLTKTVDDPIYGGRKTAPRILFEINRNF